MCHFRQFTVVCYAQSIKSIITTEHYQLPLEWGKEKKNKNKQHQSHNFPLKNRFLYLYASPITGLTSSVLPGQYSMAGDRKQLRKFIDLFLEVKGVLSIVLGDGWESQPLYVVSCTEYSLYRLYIPEGGMEQSVTARQGTQGQDPQLMQVHIAKNLLISFTKFHEVLRLAKRSEAYLLSSYLLCRCS